MAEISQNVNIEMLEKLPDGTYKRKYPKTTKEQVGLGNVDNIKQATKTEFDEHLAGDTHIPKGLISMWSGSIATIPTGWNLCNGENGTPNLTDRFIVGVGGDYEIGDTGGLDSVTLTTSQLPSHNHGGGTLSTSSAGSHSHGSGTLSTNSTGSHSHSGSTNSTGSHSHSYVDTTITNKAYGQLYTDTSDLGGDNTAGNKTTGSSGSHSHTLTINSSGSHSHTISGSTDSNGSHSHTISGSTDSNGSGQAHENRPPYFALAFIMKL